MRMLSLGRSYQKLSNLQLEIIELVKQGLTTQQIVKHFNYKSKSTVHHHYTVIKHLLKLKTIEELRIKLQ